MAANETLVCTDCGTENVAGSAFCTGCGVSLKFQSKRADNRERPSGGDAAERARARQEFARIKSSVLTLRSTYWAGAALAVVQLLLVYSVLSKDLGELLWLVQLFAWGQLAMMVAGALLVLRAPLIWAVVGAAYWTLNAVLNWWSNDFAVPPGLAVMFVMTAAFWCVVGRAARVQRLMAENPDLQIVRKRISAEQRVAGGVGDEARERRRRERQRARVARLRLAGVIAGVAVLGGGAIWWATRPPSVAAIRQQFETLWHDGKVDAVSEMFVDSRAAARLRDGMQQRGWHESPPRLAEADVDERERFARVAYRTDKGVVEASFARRERRWFLDGVELPDVEFAPLSDGIQAFREAWAARGVDALVALFRPQSRARAGASLARSLKKRGWDQERPELGEADRERASSPRAAVRFELAGDELFVRFEYWHPSWRVTGVRLPRQ